MDGGTGTMMDQGRVGRVVSRLCPCCGHHEVGVASPDGQFLPLRPGMWVGILEAPDTGFSACRVPPSPSPPALERPLCLWVPEQAGAERELRLLYGVRVPQEALGHMTLEIYLKAYLDKLEGLIARENPVEIAMLLDRLFSASYLASGEAHDMVAGLWKDLPEIRMPVEQVRAWFATSEGAKGCGGNVCAPDWEAEEEALSLEGFFTLLLGRQGA